MSKRVGYGCIVFTLLILYASLHIANAFSRGEAIKMKTDICNGMSTPMRGLRSDWIQPPMQLNSINGWPHAYITGNEKNNIINGGEGNGCYDGGDGSDEINITSEPGDRKYVIDGDNGHGYDKVFCNGARSAQLVIEGKFLNRDILPSKACIITWKYAK